MGCPQSKNKQSKDLSNGNSNIDHGSRTRNDAVRPEGGTAPSKANHEPYDYNDPKVMSRAEDVYIPDLLGDTDGQGQDNTSGKKTAVDENNVNEQVAAERNDTNKKENEIKPKTLDVNDPAEKIGTDKKENKVKPKSPDADVSFSSVFIPDTADDGSENTWNNTPTVSNETGNKIVDMSDIYVGQSVQEVSLDNQTINENGDASNSKKDKEKVKRGDSKKKQNGSTNVTEAKEKKPVNNVVEIQTADGYTYTETTQSADETPSVRYQNKDTTEYELPEGVPKPAPPKSRKSDLIKPTTFTIVDKIVDQAPGNAFNSVPKLGTYLAGTAKKSELEVKSDDEDLNEGSRLPPPRPVESKKTDLVTDSNMFKKVDDNSRETPETAVLSVDKLATHLCSAAETDMEKVRAFYHWICHNISYVYEKDSVEAARLRFDAVSTLRQGKGSYVNLFSALCKEVAIPVVIIAGCSKGLRHQPDKLFKISETNHSWNAIYFNDEWHFIDCTWGSGFVDINGKFHRHFDEFWFLTDPEVFAYDHFPTHPIWQLLKEPLDIEEFNKKPSLTERSRELGFKLISHREPIVYLENEVTITFGTETFPLSNITADLRDENGAEVNRHRCMKRIDEKTFEVRVVPPNTGEYQLMLYGKAKDYRHAKYRKLMEYTFRCDQVYSEPIIFPNHLKAWGPEPNFAELGFADSIQTMSIFKSEENEMSITFEQTKIVPITIELKPVSDHDTFNDLKEFSMITAKENCKVIHIRFPSAGYYKLDLYAEGKLEKYEYAGSFLLQCTVTDKPKAFPKCSVESISKHVCEILEPIQFELPAETMVTFRLRSSVLRKSMLGIPMEEDYGSRLKGIGELSKQGDVFSASIKTPKKGETLLLSGAAAPPNVIWSRLYEFGTV